jgi:pilus assembly protein CpaE
VTGRSSARKAKRAGLGKFMDLIKRK